MTCKDKLWYGSVDDKTAQLFSLKSNGRYGKPTKFDIIRQYGENAVQVYDMDDPKLVSFGGVEGDIVIYKKNRSKESFCKQMAFTYPKPNSLIGGEGKGSPFNVKRILVLSMNNSGNKKERRKLDESWKDDVCQLLDRDFGSVLFDSKKDSWKRGNSVFHQRVINKSDVAILIEETGGNIFGLYHQSKIEEIVDKPIRDNETIVNYDRHSYVFSLQTNNRLDEPMKFEILPVLSHRALFLYDEKADFLFGAGGVDIAVYKEDFKTRCYCIQNAFNYKGMRNVLVGGCGQSYPFTIERIMVWQMKPTEKQINELREREAKYKSQIEELCETTINKEIFNSTVDNWGIKSSIFDDRILYKKDVVVFIEDEEDNAFGVYLGSNMDNFYYRENGKSFGLANPDPYSFVFTLYSNGRLNNHRKFNIKYSERGHAFSLSRAEDDTLVNVGKDDIVVMKKSKRNRCSCEAFSYNYGSNKKVLIASTETNKRFVTKRVVVYQMDEKKTKK